MKRPAFEPVMVHGVCIGVGKAEPMAIGTMHKMVCNTLFSAPPKKRGGEARAARESLKWAKRIADALNQMESKDE